MSLFSLFSAVFRVLAVVFCLFAALEYSICLETLGQILSAAAAAERPLGSVQLRAATTQAAKDSGTCACRWTVHMSVRCVQDYILGYTCPGFVGAVSESGKVTLLAITPVYQPSTLCHCALPMGGQGWDGISLPTGCLW